MPENQGRAHGIVMTPEPPFHQWQYRCLRNLAAVLNLEDDHTTTFRILIRMLRMNRSVLCFMCAAELLTLS